MMDFSLDFLKVFCFILVEAVPIIIILLLPILMLGLLVGKVEEWTFCDSIYWSIVTATTVGYGDLNLKKTLSKFISMYISLTGIILTGFVVSLSVRSVSIVFEYSGESERVKDSLNRILK